MLPLIAQHSGNHHKQPACDHASATDRCHRRKRPELREPDQRQIAAEDERTEREDARSPEPSHRSPGLPACSRATQHGRSMEQQEMGRGRQVGACGTMGPEGG